ncbi:MAG: AAA family ATPase [Clostridiales bacterium]|nr:AAA family ATPase [Clostridiales bacterium]
MLDKLRLREALANYKRDFVSFQWKNEKYKWEAVKTFQDNWDINAPDFADMLSRSLSRTSNLLASMNNFPAGMITGFAKAAPEEVRGMFIALFDEKIDVVERIMAFKEGASRLLENYGNGAGQHYQHENAVSIYLWLRYPDKYYIYKYNEVKTVAEELGSDYRFRKGAYAENLRSFYRLYDEICAYVRTDTELTSLLQVHLSDTCYPDPEYRTLTVDVGFYISRYFSEQKSEPAQADTPEPEAAPVPCDTPQHLADDISCAPYTESDFLSQVFLSRQRYHMLAALLKRKKNVILQGAPGVGKTYAAKRLAYSMMGERDESRIAFVQFHQSYSYEDFIMGYKPSERGFELKPGVFYRFCQRAAKQPDRDLFFIIDEINRGNLSKIFGELLMLIENDYRGTPVTLAYQGEPFSVPVNLYIIGMMNTADRSLAMIDYALRRRFSFFEMEPAFDSEGFVQYQNALNNETFHQLIGKIKELNQEIAADRSLGKGFRIGHSYFSNWDECTDERMRMVVDFDILPMLDEYWFDDPAKVQRWSNILHGVFQ